jgi:hypothetical protein
MDDIYRKLAIYKVDKSIDDDDVYNLILSGNPTLYLDYVEDNPAKAISVRTFYNHLYNGKHIKSFFVFRISDDFCCVENMIRAADKYKVFTTASCIKKCRNCMKDKIKQAETLSLQLGKDEFIELFHKFHTFNYIDLLPDVKSYIRAIMF